MILQSINSEISLGPLRYSARAMEPPMPSLLSAIFLVTRKCILHISPLTLAANLGKH